MNGEITDKNYILFLKGGHKIWINETQFEMLKNLLETNRKFIQVENWVFNRDEVAYIGPRREIEITERIKKGEWQCKYGYWHNPGEECAHGELEKYNNNEGSNYQN
ncbi:MAG: hypothetical protein QW228_05715 [Candidatus Aenigmatarchaeota archaeon]